MLVVYLIITLVSATRFQIWLTVLALLLLFTADAHCGTGIYILFPALINVICIKEWSNPKQLRQTNIPENSVYWLLFLLCALFHENGIKHITLINTSLFKLNNMVQPIKSSSYLQFLQYLDNVIRAMVVRAKSNLLKHIQVTMNPLSYVHTYGRLTYEPNAGIWWYLDGQMLPEYALYFDVLIGCQPILCATVVYAVLARHHALLTVSIPTIIMCIDRILSTCICCVTVAFDCGGDGIF